ncbi:MAG: SRPBCC domain-containing protein [Candidatus Aenigmarchaeota archaeon]|nr:SRPBCC domain-containing protein [Candidatus Aenigmarchaeota archaeon]
MDTCETIAAQTIVRAPAAKAWKLWTTPEHITKWNAACANWHLPRAENDLRPGGKFRYRMEAKDGIAGTTSAYC